MMLSVICRSFFGGLLIVMALASCSSAEITPQSLHAPSYDIGRLSNYKAVSRTLLYVSDQGTKKVSIYSYPVLRKVGTLTGLNEPAGLCVNRAGSIFVTNVNTSSGSNVLEFAHGSTTASQTLDDPGMQASACAVNPVSGDLAVTNYCPLSKGECSNRRGNILIYPSATGPSRTYSSPKVTRFSFCGYTPSGTLYADGYGRRTHFFRLVKLSPKDDKLTTVAVHWTDSSPQIIDPGGVEWDGSFLAIGYPQGEHITPSIYRVDPKNGHIASVIVLKKSRSVFGFFIDSATLIAPNTNLRAGSQVLFYKYPQGNRLTKTISRLDEPYSVVLSNGGQ